MKMIIDFLSGKDFLFIVGLFCLSVAIYLSWNMWRTRSIQRSTYFWKAEFAFVGILILTFIKDTSVFLGVKIKWLFIVLDLAYMPAIQLILAFAVIFVNLHINKQWKSKKLI